MTQFEWLRGYQAASVLNETGLLQEAAVDVALPLLSTDILEIVNSPDGFAMIGYDDTDPIGYVVGQVHFAGRGERHLFIHQAWTRGKPGMSKDAFAMLEKMAGILGCQGISTTAPLSLAKALQRRYKFTPTGMYMVHSLNGKH